MRKDSLFLNFCQSNPIKLLSLFFILILFALGSTLFTVYSKFATAPADPPVALESPSPVCCEKSSHTLVGSYSIEGNFTAKLLLNNKGVDPLEIHPALYDFLGQEFPLPPITVDSQSFKFIDLQDWVTAGGESYKTGTIRLRYDGIDLVLGAQINFADEARSLSFEERLLELGRFNSQSQEAVWWMPSEQATVRVIMTNTADAPLSVTAQLSKKPHATGALQTFEFAPNETKVLDLRQDFTDGNQFAASELIALSLQHAAATNDALIARVWVSEENRGYSNTIRFSNPSGGKSQEYHGAGFQIENIGDIRFQPVIIARNVGTQVSVVTARVPYTRTDGTKGVIALPKETIKPGRSARLNTDKILQRVPQEQIAVAGLEIAYDTAPGSVIVFAQSVSADRNHVFRVLMSDPLAARSASGGYPWRTDGTSTTQVYIKNVADFEQDYVAFLVWENGGTYSFGINPIGGHETINIDIKRLRDEQIPDEMGRTIPASVSSGQIHWSIRRKDDRPADDALAVRSLIGRSQQVDIAKGIVTDYVCISCCAYSYMGAYVRPYPDLEPWSSTQDTIAVGQTISYTAVEKQTDCNGNVPIQEGQLVYVNASSWSSSDTSVATVSSSGHVTAVGPGSATILASWQTRSWYAMAGSCRSTNPYNVSGARTINVAPNIRILKDGNDITSTPQNANVQSVIIGQRINLSATVTGGTPTSPQWTIPGTKVANYVVTYTDESSPTSAVVTELTSQNLAASSVQFYWVDGSSTVRNVQYSVTVGNTTYSATAKFDVKIPSGSVTREVGTPGISSFQGDYGLWFGKTDPPPPVPGIVFSRSMTIPTGFSGEFQWVQVWNKLRRIKWDNVWRRSEGTGLDSIYPYETGPSANDSPGIPFETNYQAVSIDEAFDMYLMFRPASETSIWVPLKKITWGWNAQAENNTGWALIGTPSAFANPPVDSTTHPQWSINAGELGYSPE